jgi:hypothetical protein
MKTKRIKKADLKHATKSIELDWVVDDINAGGSRQEQALWILNPRCMEAGTESKRAMSELIYSLAKNVQSSDAWYVFTEVADKIGTCQSFIERWLRGMSFDKKYDVSVQTNLGLNCIIIN